MFGVGAQACKHGASEFTTTHWSVIVAASDPASPLRAEALEKLCATYWYPIYAFARYQGEAPADAQDLTQSFFAGFLEKNSIGRADPTRGRFRTFLLASFRNFLSNQWRRARCARRGGGREILSLDADHGESRYELEPKEWMTPDKLFERSWAVATLEKAVADVSREYASQGKAQLFVALKRLLWDEAGKENYAQLAQRLGLSEAAVKMAVSRLRKRCREALRAQVEQTVCSLEDVDEELRHILATLRN